MNRIPIIIAREYLIRVRKKSFIIMSVLGPILFAAMMIIPAWLAQVEETDVKKIAVVDSSNIFYKVIPETEFLKFDYLENVRINNLKQNYKNLGYYGILYISHIAAFDPNSVILYSEKQPSLATKMHISKYLEEYIRDQKLKTYNIENLDEILRGVKTTINIRTIKISEEGEEKESSTGIMMAVGYISGILMYMFLIFCGTMVMRGVVEEKTSRIIEVIISSVKPFQLMFGKIVGIAMVGLTQLLIWIISTFILVSVAQAIFFPEFRLTPTEQVISQDIMTASPADSAQSLQSEEMNELRDALSTLKNVNFAVIILTFLFYFIGGYLLYASLFAAIGAAVDSETDTQQFVFPILLPLILGIIVLFSITNNPESPIALWFSIIPFTSPIVMMARIPFGVPWPEFFLSAGLLIVFFIGSTWLAGKIYRTGILMYGKKATLKEMLKWVTYKT